MAILPTDFFTIPSRGDYRSRESNVYRLAEVSTNIIDQCVAQGVPFARDYGGLLGQSFFWGCFGIQNFYAKGQTGQQLLLGAYSAMNRQIGRGKIKMYNRHEMMDLVLVDGKARGSLPEIWSMAKLKDTVLMQWSLPLEDTEMYSFYRPTRWEVMFLLHGKFTNAARILPIRVLLKYTPLVFPYREITNPS